MIKVQPATPGAKLPEKLVVRVTVANGIGEPRSFAAQSAGNGVFRVKVTPVPRDPDRQVDLDVRSPSGRVLQVQVKDGTVKVGDTKFMLSDLRVLNGVPAPRAQTARGQLVFGPILGLGKVKTQVGNKTVTIDLNQASQIVKAACSACHSRRCRRSRRFVEVKQGSKVLATVLKRADLTWCPAPLDGGRRPGRTS